MAASRTTAMAQPEFRLPGGTDRICIIGPTGSGKTVLGGWVLSRQRFSERPWVALDYKDEELWDKVGDPPMRRLRLGAMPGKQGLYRMSVRPGQEDELEAWLWKVWEKGNIGLFCDEVSLVPQKDAFKAILRQGRSKHIPVIACTQRPVGCDREVFSESQYMVSFGVADQFRDYPIVRGLFGETDVRTRLPRHNCYWYDVKQDHCFVLKPCPPPASIAATLKQAVPYSIFLSG